MRLASITSVGSRWRGGAWNRRRRTRNRVRDPTERRARTNEKIVGQPPDVPFRVFLESGTAGHAGAKACTRESCEGCSRDPLDEKSYKRVLGRPQVRCSSRRGRRRCAEGSRGKKGGGAARRRGDHASGACGAAGHDRLQSPEDRARISEHHARNARENRDGATNDGRRSSCSTRIPACASTTRASTERQQSSRHGRRCGFRGRSEAQGAP